jgi:hypothetical protein
LVSLVFGQILELIYHWLRKRSPPRWNRIGSGVRKFLSPQLLRVVISAIAGIALVEFWSDISAVIDGIALRIYVGAIVVLFFIGLIGIGVIVSSWGPRHVEENQEPAT